MSKFSLRPQATKSIELKIYKKQKDIEYLIESSNIIKVYLVDNENYVIFMDGEDFTSFNNTIRGTNITEKINLDPGMYHFIFYNPSETEIVRINFELITYYNYET